MQKENAKLIIESYHYLKGIEREAYLKMLITEHNYTAGSNPRASTSLMQGKLGLEQDVLFGEKEVSIHNNLNKKFQSESTMTAMKTDQT